MLRWLHGEVRIASRNETQWKLTHRTVAGVARGCRNRARGTIERFNNSGLAEDAWPLDRARHGGG